MALVFQLLGALLPSLLIVWMIRTRTDHTLRRFLWPIYAAGLLTVPGVLGLLWLVELVIDLDGFRNPYMAGFVDAFAGAAIPEELLKLSVVLCFTMRIRKIEHPLEGIVVGVVAALGFSSLENVLYVSHRGFGNAVARTLTCVPAHASWGAMMGCFVGLAQLNPSRRGRHWACAIFVPILFHGAFDFPILALSELAPAPPTSDLAIVIGLLMWLLTTGSLYGGVFWAWRMIRRHWREPESSQESTAHSEPRKGSKPTYGWPLIVAGVLLTLIGAVLLLLLAAMLAMRAIPRAHIVFTVHTSSTSALVPFTLGLILLWVGRRRLRNAGERDRGLLARTV